MKDSDSAVAKIIPWGADAYGIHIDYGAGSWRAYLVGSQYEARQELARFTLDLAERRREASWWVSPWQWARWTGGLPSL